MRIAAAVVFVVVWTSALLTHPHLLCPWRSERARSGGRRRVATSVSRNHPFSQRRPRRAQSQTWI